MRSIPPAILVAVILLAAVSVPRNSFAQTLAYDNENPVWSPDGRWIAFRGERDGNPDIHVVEVATGRTRRLTSHPASDSAPTWSRDGSRVFFSSGRREPRQLFSVAVDGTDVRQVTDLPFMVMFADWSPDGRQLVFNLGSRGEPPRQVFRMDADGGNLVQLTEGAFHSDYASWTGEGQILFESDRTGSWRSYLMNSDGSSVRMVADVEVTGPRISPDGSRIAFQRRVGGLSQIFVMRADGSGIEQLTFGASGNNGIPDWAPDGASLAFNSDRTGVSEIYLMKVDGTGVEQLTDRDR